MNPELIERVVLHGDKVELVIYDDLEELGVAVKDDGDDPGPVGGSGGGSGTPRRIPMSGGRVTRRKSPSASSASSRLVSDGLWLPTPYAARTVAVPVGLPAWVLSRQPREFQERRPCSGPGCRRPVYARGLCRPHYKRWLEGTWVPAIEPVRVRKRREWA